jgi:RNA polymerase sigma factor (TIGR02999 family)
MADNDRPITELLHLLGQGDRRGLDRLMEVLRTTLLRRCRRQVGKVPGGALTGTELLDELYLYLARRFSNLPKLANRDSFFAYAHEAMKHLAMDARRKERAKKRGGHMRGVPIEDLRDDIPDERPDQEWVEIFEVLARVEAQDPEVAEMAKLRVFDGLSGRAAAAELGISREKAQRQWVAARSLLVHLLGVDRETEDAPV